MNDEINKQIEITDLYLRNYESQANILANYICDWIIKNKKWDCTFTLGGYEEGADTITIIFNEDPKNRICCFNGMLEFEHNVLYPLAKGKRFDLMIRGPLKPNHCEKHPDNREAKINNVDG